MVQKQTSSRVGYVLAVGLVVVYSYMEITGKQVSQGFQVLTFIGTGFVFLGTEKTFEVLEVLISKFRK